MHRPLQLITGKTKVYGIFGNPVAHSCSPIIQNLAFKEKDLDCIYVPFQVTDLRKAMAAVKSMNIQGLSVTIPYKIEVLSYLDDIDPLAFKIGAVNTILNHEHKLIGYNTDGIGAVNALKEKGIEVKDKTVALIGFGGAARSIAFALCEEKPTKIVIWGLDEPAAHQLADDVLQQGGVDTEFIKITDACAYDILINCSPVGMHPDINKSPISYEQIIPGKTVFDIIYNPKETFLIREARQKKCEIVYGYKMLLLQGVEQFRLWTGLEAPTALMEQALLQQLEK